jgi:membrane protein required for colicin V production
MNTVDIVISVILLFGLIRGYIKGLFIEITSLVGLVLGIYGAIHFSYFLSNILKSRVDWDASMIQIIAFTGTFLIILLALIFIGKTLTKIAETASLGLFNKMLGALFGILKYALILSIVFIVYDKINSSLKFVNKKEVNQSVLYDPVKNFAPALFPKLVKVIEEDKTK